MVGIGWVVEAIAQLLPLAEPYRVHVVIENHDQDGQGEHPEFAQRFDRFSAIVDQIDLPRFGVPYDLSHALVAEQDPLAILRRFQSRGLTMHASDRHLKDGFHRNEMMEFRGQGYPEALEHGVIGEGFMAYAEIMGILRDRQFAGWISIEDGVRGFDDLKASAEFLRRLRDTYFTTPDILR